jgi:hypothetical protein
MHVRKLLTLFLLVLASSCHKKEEDNHTPTATITLSNPLPDQISHKGDTMHITGAIVGTATLHGYTAFILNTKTTDTLLKWDSDDHSKTIQINKDWIDTLEADADLTLYLSSTLNHDGLKAEKQITFHHKAR